MCAWRERIVRRVGGVTRGDLSALVPPPLVPRREVPAGALPATLAGVGEAWEAASGLAGAFF